MSALEPSFVEHLKHQFATAPPAKRGLRTRQRLVIAAAQVLEQKGYHALRVTDVSDAAGVAEASFYVYFRDKKDITIQVLTLLLDEYFGVESQDAEHASVFGKIQLANRGWIAMCRANAGLMRCILQVGDDIPEFYRLAQRANRTWYERVAQSVSRHRPEQGINPAALHLAYMLGAMADEIVRKLIIYPDPDYLALLEQTGMNDEAVADAMSLVWMHVLYPGVPIGEASLHDAAVELAHTALPRLLLTREAAAGG
ncbi:TetR/AcrR family transcriptional regulator [Phenylobacterium sp. LH3H17]|uniref:TetR/AcrR family transcriptional regulator n=1 Tax=Phenylobacterium sp. LH3H17 TaxID=2903901 RepID=UPI0020C98B51|nr:TetR/AcrR family transcriptional regulator [Phenylobacterium sp. LH3H17]UTP38311.1 TetR/AcrR family transcriptional regulator [Phenylobacterium sp. LH3H17]